MGEEGSEGEQEDEVSRARHGHGCPVLWVRIDPDMQWIAEVGGRRPIHTQKDRAFELLVVEYVWMLWVVFN